MTRIEDARERADRWSPFLSGLIARDLGTAQALADDADMPLMRRLRLERRRLALEVALGDLSGALDLTAVTARLSDFADGALDRAIAAAIAERTPGEARRGFAAIALGKQGSHELNYSSDIDPILIYDPATLPHRPREDVADAAVRIARRVLELLQGRDADGYVLRVDLRLRPSPEVTPIAIPVDAAISYYESQALAWERAAFIRARAAAGDMALGRRFLDAIRPFVWRRSLDFGAVGEILDITRRIRDHHAQGQAFGAGFDLKRGRGGIREVEFFAQIHQLIHGGREPALRTSATRDALAALAAAGRIDAGEAAALTEAYTLLRTIEHRVQMIDDRQTHALPAAGEPLDRVARLHGLADGAALLELLAPHVERVAAIFDRLAPHGPRALPHDADRLAERLAEAGFAETEEPVRRIAAALALGHGLRLEGHPWLAHLDLAQQEVGGPKDRAHLHLVDDPRGLQVPGHRNEALLAQVEDLGLGDELSFAREERQRQHAGVQRMPAEVELHGATMPEAARRPQANAL